MISSLLFMLEMITFYETKMKIMAEENEKETLAELDEIDAKFSKIAADLSKDFYAALESEVFL